MNKLLSIIIYFPIDRRQILILFCFSILIFLSLNSKAQRIISNEEIIEIATIHEDSLQMKLISNNLKYGQKLLIALRFFHSAKNKTNVCLLGELIPNNPFRVKVYWEIDRYIWMERNLNFFKQEYGLEAKSFDFIKLNTFFELVLLSPNFISDMYQFSLHSKNKREVAVFSDFYLYYIFKYEDRFFKKIKQLPEQDAMFIIKLINDLSDYELLLEAKRIIKTENLNYMNSLVKEGN